MSNPQAPLLQALEPESKIAWIEYETGASVDENKQKEEHLYPSVGHPPMAPSTVWLAQGARDNY